MEQKFYFLSREVLPLCPHPWWLSILETLRNLPASRPLDFGPGKWHNRSVPTSTIPDILAARISPQPRAHMEDEVGISTAPSVTVRIPPALLSRTGGRRNVPASGRTVREVFDSLGRDYPGLL